MTVLEQPLVSVIIPLYNAERHVEQCIQSVLDQTYPNIEIIIVNDGSTDGSSQIANTFAAEGVILISQANKGASSARNAGLSKANGTYIQFLDADDFISSNKIAEQVGMLNGLETKLCGCPCVHFADGDDYKNIDIPIDWFSNGIDDTSDFLVKLYGGSLIGDGFGGMVALHSWLIPKALITQAGLWNEELTLDDDGEFMCRILLSANGILYTSKVLTYYRKYKNFAGNISSTRSRNAHESLFKSICLRKDYLLTKRNDKLSRRALSRIFHEVAISFYPDCPDLTNRAEEIALHLDPAVKPLPYKTYPYKAISELFGWRTMRRLSIMKIALVNSFKSFKR